MIDLTAKLGEINDIEQNISSKSSYFRLYNANHIVGRICNNFKKNRSFYDKSMKLGTWLVDSNTKKLRVSATPKMSSNGGHLVFS